MYIYIYLQYFDVSIPLFDGHNRDNRRALVTHNKTESCTHNTQHRALIEYKHTRSLTPAFTLPPLRQLYIVYYCLRRRLLLDSCILLLLL